MVVFGSRTGKAYQAGQLLSRAGEGATYRIDGHRSLLLKIFDRTLSPKAIEKLSMLSSFKKKPSFTALPLEPVYDPATKTVIGFVQDYFSKTVPLARVLDDAGRSAAGFPNDFTFRVKLCRLLAESFVRLHAANLIVGDVSDGNFLVGQGAFGRATVVYGIDCNSYQFSVRTPVGNEVFLSGVATEECAAPEVQPTDWSTSLRTVFSDSFGFGVLAWKILFGGSHPFAMVTPRNVDVPPLGKRIEARLFPFSPPAPLPAGWKPPPINPSLAVLPADIREMFFRTFSAIDPRDRPESHEWHKAFRSWETAVTPSLPLRVLGTWNGSLADHAAKVLSRIKPWVGRASMFFALVGFTLAYPYLASLTPAKLTVAPAPLSSDAAPNSWFSLYSDRARKKPARPRMVDAELFPELVKPSRSPAPE